ncbi:MAG: anti-sigma factor [Candidatus Dormibacteria bacterium]
MRCSLLTLSSYVDSELPPERTGELEAHLIACQRCSTALTYLREEAERIRTLARVRVPEGTADKVLLDVGLAVSATATPPPEPAPVFTPVLEPTLDLPMELPAKPQTLSSAVAHVGSNGSGHGTNGTTPAASTAVVEVPGTVFGVRHDEPPHDDPIDRSPPHEEPALQLDSHEAPPSEPVAAVAPDDETQPPRPGPSSFFDRMRDALAVRMALMRSARGEEELDDSVQIVSGTGAPGWASTPGQQTHRERRERMAASASIPDDQPPTPEPVPIAAEEPPPQPTAPEPPTPEPPLPEPSPAVPEWYQAPPAQPPPEQPAAISEPARPGRHQRALASGRTGAARTWAGIRSLATPRQGGVERPIRDRRLWAYGAGVVVLLVIGLLVGKSVTTVPPTARVNVPNPTAIPLNPTATAPALQHTPQPTTAPTAHATATPTPTPSTNPAAQLSNAKTLGSGGSGTVQDVRYGAHPGDFRIVFDISNAGGDPTVIIGNSDPTTIYVEYQNVTPNGAPAQPPPGNVATSMQLVQPSLVPGKVVYKITLAHAANLSAEYLSGPTRLVIDLS